MYSVVSVRLLTPGWGGGSVTQIATNIPPRKLFSTTKFKACIAEILVQ